MPFDVWHALVRLDVGHLAVRPDVLFFVFRTVGIGCETVHQRHFLAEFPVEVHLAQELGGAAEPVVVARGGVALAVLAEEPMRPVCEEMKFGRNLHAPELAVDHRRGVRRIIVVSAVEHAHRAGLRVELEAVVETDVDRIAVARVRHAQPIGEGVCYGACDGPVDVAGHFHVESVHRLVCRGLGTCRKQSREMGACGHGYHADLLGIVAALRRLRTHHPHGALSILPRRLVDRKSFRTRGTICERHATHADPGKLPAPLLDQPHIAAAFVPAA